MQDGYNADFYPRSPEFAEFDSVNSPSIYLPSLFRLPKFNDLYSDEALGIKSELQTSFAPDGTWDQLIKNRRVNGSLQQTNQYSTLQPKQYGNKVSYVKNWLKLNAGLNNAQATALTAVWYAESGLNPGIHEIGKESNPYAGKGIALWTGRARQQHAENLYRNLFGLYKPIKEMTLDELLAVAVAEFKLRTGNWNAFLNSQSLDQATDIVWRGYENGGNNALATIEQMNKAYKSANTVQKQYRDRINFARQFENL